MHLLSVPPARQTHSHLRGSAWAVLSAWKALSPRFPPHLPPAHHSDHLLQGALPDPIHSTPASPAAWHRATLDTYLLRECVREGEDSYSCRVENTACGSLVPCHPILPPLGTMNLVMALWLQPVPRSKRRPLSSQTLSHSPSPACHGHVASVASVTAELGI